jgi:hypothetical protein
MGFPPYSQTDPAAPNQPAESYNPASVPSKEQFTAARVKAVRDAVAAAEAGKEQFTAARDAAKFGSAPAPVKAAVKPASVPSNVGPDGHVIDRSKL